jgi:hypothetical protein
MPFVVIQQNVGVAYFCLSLDPRKQARVVLTDEIDVDLGRRRVADHLEGEKEQHAENLQGFH